ncbi:50S ribosomal protein L22 [Candidatus Microgenomates bacterium]|nr:MAG: 50S ribosomal protein L22 [Candidatus Microgenomates bacterium]
MQAISTQKFVRMSPRKLRLVADMVRKMKPSEALETLPFVPKRAAEPMLKTIKSAVANATVLGMSPDSLVFKEVLVSEGPKLKRFRAVSRGRAHGYVKQMSHIRVIVGPEELEAPPVKAEVSKPKKKKTVTKK